MDRSLDDASGRVDCGVGLARTPRAVALRPGNVVGHPGGIHFRAPSIDALLVVVATIVLPWPVAAGDTLFEIEDRLCAKVPALSWDSLPKTRSRPAGKVGTYRFHFASWRTTGVPENDVIEGEIYEQPGDGSHLVLLIPG